MTEYRESTKPYPAGRLLTLFETQPAGPSDLSTRDIHDIRVAIKQTRAWLKLCRAACGDTQAYQQLMDDLRELGQALSAQRDRDVMLQTLAKLADKYPGKKAGRLIQTLREQIVRQDVPRADSATFNSLVTRIRRQLPGFTELVLSRQTRITVIQRGFIKMCKTGKRALGSGECTDLHAWRKRVKRLLYQLEIAEDSLPGQDRAQARLRKLGSRLGEVHDLCVLQTIVEEMAVMTQPPLDGAPLCKRIQRERHSLIKSCRKHYRGLCPSGR